MEHEQQEMIPKTPKESAEALQAHIISEKAEEMESYAKRSEKHKIAMKYFDLQLKHCEIVLAAVPDEYGVIKEAIV